MSKLLVAALLLASLGLPACAHGERPAVRSAAKRAQVERDTQAPYGLELTLLDGQSEVQLATYAGRLVLLMISLPDCEACSDLQPKLEALARELQGESIELAFLTILLEPPSAESPRSPNKAVRWGDPRLASGETRLGEMDAVPLTWLVSRTGVPLLRYEGMGDETVALLREDIRGYLRVEGSF